MVIRHYSKHLIKHWSKLAIALFFLSIFFYLSLIIDNNNLDKELLLLITSMRTPALNGPAVDITALGSVTLLTLFTTFLLILFALKKHWFNFFQLLIAQAGSGLISRTTKAMYMRPRPSIVESLVSVTHYSYPSGHSLAVATFYVTIGLILCEYYRSHYQRMAIFFLGAVMMILVGGSRIYLGVHYPSDVLGGLAMGSAWALIIPAFLSYHRRDGRQDHADAHRLPAHN